MNTVWHYAWSKPTLTGNLKTTPQDFFVEEVLGFVPDGQGEFVFVFIEKVGVNTDYLAKRLASYADIDPSKVTYSGVKDRHACTRQWFCLHLLGKDIDFSDLSHGFRDNEQVRVIEVARHSKKLRVGTHIENRFIIRIRSLKGDLIELENRLSLVKMAGVPNYYGAQRFGIQGNNLENGLRWLEAGRKGKKRLSKTESFWLSAMRSWCFNQALSDQIESRCWNSVFIGDIAQEAHSSTQFRIKSLTPGLLLRQMTMKIQPVLPLISKGWQDGTSEKRAQMMRQSLAGSETIVEGLLNLDLSRDSRVTRLSPNNMEWELFNKDSEYPEILMQFSLPKGAFATSVLREIVDINDCSTEKHDASIDSK
ncbi:tRNA pseudouridine(13) synthase TruD [Marinomonas sp. 15G1-11]|mgnify:CR=1 FL=1|uniref:tRNA pseudouridine synthase D n=1 Tax=Marinomonas phaeophyticola TaxID=3004091 RepID=A0ABT4JTR8_9GAMM|nr:tRNA pseudouridine(13) synthase TruD [Marinomonas sp. 15G1-11]MCZ2721729.1 tRNA pseudouridine(13) synthase TruD [Marinomonas sp. 15G1-11]